jgi:dihydroxyacetone kinase-like protein
MRHHLWQLRYDAMLEADTGAGVACLFGNYAGDNMNVKMAIQMAEDDDIEVKYVVATDDVAINNLLSNSDYFI